MELWVVKPNNLQRILFHKYADRPLITEANFFKYSNIYILVYHLLQTYNPNNTAHGRVLIQKKYSNIHFVFCILILFVNNIKY